MEQEFSHLYTSEVQNLLIYYYFDGWSGDADSPDQSLVDRMVKPINVHSIWKEIVYGNVFLAVIPVIVAVGILSWFILRKKFKGRNSRKLEGSGRLQ